jgi:hypothetical protein
VDRPRDQRGTLFRALARNFGGWPGMRDLGECPPWRPKGGPAGRRNRRGREVVYVGGGGAIDGCFADSVVLGPCRPAFLLPRRRLASRDRPWLGRRAPLIHHTATGATSRGRGRGPRGRTRLRRRGGWCAPGRRGARRMASAAAACARRSTEATSLRRSRPRPSLSMFSLVDALEPLLASAETSGVRTTSRRDGGQSPPQQGPAPKLTKSRAA